MQAAEAKRIAALSQEDLMYVILEFRVDPDSTVTALLKSSQIAPASSPEDAQIFDPAVILTAPVESVVNVTVDSVTPQLAELKDELAPMESVLDVTGTPKLPVLKDELAPVESVVDVTVDSVTPQLPQLNDGLPPVENVLDVTGTPNFQCLMMGLRLWKVSLTGLLTLLLPNLQSLMMNLRLWKVSLK
jgi:tetrahydromethanopterin S-methyltransferase subunit B